MGSQDSAINIIYNDTHYNNSDWTRPLHLSDTALIDLSASMKLMNKKAKAKLSAAQESNKHLTITNGYGMKTTETLKLFLNKLPIVKKGGFQNPDIHNNLLAVCELWDAGCDVNFHLTGITVD